MKDQAPNPDQTKPPETPTDQKPPEDKKPEGEKKADDKPKAGPPEKYEAYKLPEGVTLKEESLTKANELFKTLGLDQTQAQSLVDFHVEALKEAMDAPYSTYTETRKGWRDEIKADPVLGPKEKEVQTTVSKMIDSLGADVADGVREALNITGAGDHPGMARGLYALAQLVTEGTAVRSGGPTADSQKAPGQGAPSVAKALYPNNP